MLTLLAFALVCSPVNAAEVVGRDTVGHLVTAGRQPEALVFFDVRCSECLGGVPALREAGVDVVLVSEDAAGERSTVAPFLAALGLTGPFIADSDGSIARRFGSSTTPATVLLDRDGGVAMRQRRAEDLDALVATAAALPRRDEPSRLSSAP